MAHATLFRGNSFHVTSVSISGPANTHATLSFVVFFRRTTSFPTSRNLPASERSCCARLRFCDSTTGAKRVARWRAFYFGRYVLKFRRISPPAYRFVYLPRECYKPRTLSTITSICDERQLCRYHHQDHLFTASSSAVHLPRFTPPRSSFLTSITTIPIHQAQDRSRPDSSLVKTHRAQDFSLK